MNEPKTGKKPDEAGGAGGETGGSAEVGGRTRQAIYYCFNCGRGNYVDPSWKYFVCWHCGPSGLNYI
jgi:hypothetical protein